MVSYLQIEGLTKSYGDRMMFADVTLGIYQGDKIGLIAPNGQGKTTLLRIISGEEGYDSGKVVFRNGLRVGYLPQDPVFDAAKSLIENVKDAIPAEAHLTEEGRESRARQLLGMAGVEDMLQDVATMSGGQRKRAAIARLLAMEADMLVLDEPTNHLDISMIEWLEDYLSRSKTTLLMVTHDRYFLDNVCNKILEIDNEQVYSYSGNYDYYVRKKTEREEASSAELARVKNLLRTEREWMRRQPQARGSKAKYRIDHFYELEAKSQRGPAKRDVALEVKSSYIGSKIFEARGVSKSFGDKAILRDWSYDFARYEKVGIVGDNGTGKTTFIKLLTGELSPDAGSIDVGETVRWGYYSQDGMPAFDPGKKVIDAVRDIAETVRIDEKTTLTASQFLTHFLFTPKRQQDYIEKLSGGERRRLYLATVLMKNPNFLVLDEPTNDLDISTLAVLEDYLVNFKGCVLVVSHDRYFLDRIVDHLFVFRGGGEVRDFPGDYSTYRHCRRNEAQEQEKQPEKGKGKSEETRRAGRDARKGLSFKEKREKEELEQKLPLLEKEKRELEEKMSSGECPVEQLASMGSRIGEIIKEIEEGEERILELLMKEEG